MRTTHLWGTALVLMLMVASSASAVSSVPLQNGGFETGDLQHWGSIGNTGVVSDFGGLIPTAEGSYQAHLEARGGILTDQLETFLGLGAGDLNTFIGVTTFVPADGSAIRQDFDILGGPSHLAFDFRFLHVEEHVQLDGPGMANPPYVMHMSYPDTIVAVLDGNVYPVFDYTQAMGALTGQALIGNSWKDFTDYMTFQFPDELAPGWHTLGIAIFGEVMQGSNTFGGTFIDNVRTTQVIPEPVTATLGMMGLGALGLTLRRRRWA